MSSRLQLAAALATEEAELVYNIARNHQTFAHNKYKAACDIEKRTVDMCIEAERKAMSMLSIDVWNPILTCNHCPAEFESCRAAARIVDATHEEWVSAQNATSRAKKILR